MRKFTTFFLFTAIFLSCQVLLSQEASILEKVANAHGFENWKNVKEISFTFNVDRDTKHSERGWVWKPKSNDVTSISEEGTLEYNRADMDSIAYKKNGSFINDKFWLLAPFQLVWDGANLKHEHTAKAKAPISKKLMQKLTIVYGNEGGYTPGDAYDFYFGDDYLVQEWVFRRGNQTEPSMTTTFEDYEEVGGLKIAKSHKMAEGKFNLFFTDIAVKN
ncbi:hypothetical protein [Aurantibacter sp.]|uniref:hypothetical protein n=1 Tax=Aurantibacter sp. TaxID=2807103 RepID=UPI003264BAEE